LWAAVAEVVSGKIPIRTGDQFPGLTLFFVLRRFVELENLETNDVYRRKEDLEIPVSKLVRYGGY